MGRPLTPAESEHHRELAVKTVSAFSVCLSMLRSFQQFLLRVWATRMDPQQLKLFATDRADRDVLDNAMIKAWHHCTH